MSGLAVIMGILGSVGAIAFIVMVAGNTGGGCLSIILGLVLAGGYIGGNIGAGTSFGALGVAIFNLVGIILGIIGIKKMREWKSSSSSGSSFNSYAYHESRKNDPHTCGNCTKYSSARGECRLDGNSTSAEESCSNWC